MFDAAVRYCWGQSIGDGNTSQLFEDAELEFQLPDTVQTLLYGHAAPPMILVLLRFASGRSHQILR